MRVTRYPLELLLGLLFISQSAIIAGLCYNPGAGYFSTLIGLLLINLILIGAALWMVWRARPQAVRARLATLALWIDDIDVSADYLPRAPESRSDGALRVSAAVRTLVARLHEYRKKLLIRHQRIQRLLRNVTDVLYHTDQQGKLTWVSDSVTEMLGYSADELLGYPFKNLLVDPASDLPTLTQNASTVRHPTRVFRRDGSTAWLLISSRRIDNAEGQNLGAEGICRDGTRLIETQRQLNQVKERAQVTLAAIGDGVVTTNAACEVDYINPRGQQMLSRRLDQVQGHAFDNTCRLYDPERKEFVSGLVADCLSTGVCRECTTALALVEDNVCPPSGQDYRSVTVTVSAMRDEDSRIIGAVVVLHDVTRLERVSRELTYLANHDSLTGLLNRRAFERKLRHLLESVQREKTWHTLCYLDLDQFKLVNDSCGHHAGDAMLRQVASQMATQLRPTDILARLGGDEFGIVFQEADLDTAQAAAERLRQWLEGFRFRWDNKIFRLGASFGLSVVGGQATSAAELLRRADTACYLAKEQGRNQVRVYHRDSDEARMRDYEITRMQHINESLDNHGFVLYAQPILPLGTNSADRPAGVELLLRMRDENSQILPQDVLLTAERYSMASRIDRWVIDNALRLISHREARRSGVGYYSLNISGQSITDEQFVGFVRDCIDQSGVDPSRLVFEITETAAVTNLQRAADLMHTLRAIGCRFALDDFGSGVSSFSYLKHLPTDFVKIDGKLVRHISEDPVERSIVEALGKVSREVGMRTVAEHVETKAQLDVLADIGIDYVQGYYIGRPAPFEQYDGQRFASQTSCAGH